ncbi:hypothetical protein ACWEQA_18020 [Nocardia sp. NPDC004085]
MGPLLQTGTHAQLLGEDGPYRRLGAAYVGDETASVGDRESEAATSPRSTRATGAPSWLSQVAVGSGGRRDRFDTEARPTA